MVLITYKGKSRNVPKRYLSGLEGKEREQQIKSIFEGTTRPKTSFVTRKSSYTTKFNAIYGKQLESMEGKRNLKNISIVTKIPLKALEAIFKKGKAAYYNGGSRPNQTPESWAYARVYSYIMGGNTRKIDKEVTLKYKVRFIH